MKYDGDPTVLSTFTGAGGLDLGLEAAGFRVLGCVENDSMARKTLNANRPAWPLLEPSDIVPLASSLTASDLCLEVGELDLLTGGPPCQTFSKAAQWSKNGRKGLEAEDCESSIDAFLLLIKRLKPKAILIENVPGFARGKTDAIPYLESFFEALEEEDAEASYNLESQIVNAADYGVPQRRKRALVVAFRNREGLGWPDPTHEDKPVRAWDALGDVSAEDPPSARGKWAALLPSIPEGNNYQWHTEKGGGEQLFGYRTRFWSFLLKLAKNQPSWTLQAQPGPATGPFHWDNRPLTVKEMLRLQSFPSSWTVCGDRRQQTRQIGNATPPLLAEVFGRAIRARLEGAEFPEPPTLAIPRRQEVPDPEGVSDVPAQYRELIDDHEPHPGPGKGPDPVMEVGADE